MKTAAITAEAWNALYPVGTPVRYWNIAGNPSFVDTRTRSEAWGMGTDGTGDQVVSIEGRAGGVSLSHLLPIPGYQVVSLEQGTGVGLIAQERQEQVNKHGYDPEHDREHDDGALQVAAAHCLAQNLIKWPFTSESPNAKGYCRIHQLKVAGALIAAEIDRLLAAGETKVDGK